MNSSCKKKEICLEKIVYLALVLVAFCLPLFPKTATFLIGLAVLAALADNILAGSCKLTFDFPFWVVLSFAGWAGISLFNSPNFAESSYNYLVLLPQYILIYWLTISYVKSSRQIYSILGALLSAGLIVACYGIYQYFYDGVMLSASWVDSEYFPTLKTRAFSTLYNPNILAAFLVMCLGLSLSGIVSKIKLSWQVFLTLVAFSSLACLLFTFSRTFWVSFVFICLTLGILYSYKFFFIWLVMLGGAFFLAHETMLERFISVFNGADTSSLLRFALWESTSAMIQNNPVSGVGWGAYKFVYPAYDFYINNPEVIIYHAHNMYLNIAAETGLIGLVLFLFSLVLHIYFAGQVYFKKFTEDQKALAMAFSCIFVGIIIGGLTDHTLFNLELCSIFWLLCALTYVLWRESRQFSKMPSSS